MKLLTLSLSLSLSMIAAGYAALPPRSSVQEREVVSGADRAGQGTLSLESIAKALDRPGAHDSFVPAAPLGITGDLGQWIPEDNPVTPAKVELGRQLFFDSRLSRDSSIACATCHDPAKGWTDSSPVSTGIDGQQGDRSAPTVTNRLLGTTQFWDGRAASLEEQALGPIGNPIEMGFSPEEAAERLESIPGYRIQFRAVFGGPATPDRMAKAIATFERTVLSGANENDYYERAMPLFDWDPDDEEDDDFRAQAERILDQEAEHRMSAAAERGRGLFFGKASCSACHVGHNLTDEEFHNIGTGIRDDGTVADRGRASVTKREENRAAFKTPTMRDVVLTAPYMHDGSLATLEDVVEHYDRGGVPNPNLSDKIFPLKLSREEKSDLVRFLKESLTGSGARIDVSVQVPAGAK